MAMPTYAVSMKGLWEGRELKTKSLMKGWNNFRGSD